MAEPSPHPTFKHLYKYGGVSDGVSDGVSEDRLQWLGRLLVHHELYMPLASQLNDLREARPRLKSMSVEEYVEFMKERMSVSQPTMSESARVAQERWCEEAALTIGVEELAQVTVTALHEMLTTYRIYSMSKRWDNLSMWQWYGEIHSGYCVEFTDLRMHGAIPREVVYGDIPDFDIRTTKPDVGSVLFVKSRDWSNEEEVRLVLPNQFGPVLPIEPAHITRVFVGKDMSPANVARVREWARIRVPPIPVLSLCWDQHKASLVIVDPG